MNDAAKEGQVPSTLRRTNGLGRASSNGIQIAHALAEALQVILQDDPLFYSLVPLANFYPFLADLDRLFV